MIPQYLNLGRRDTRDNGRAAEVPNDGGGDIGDKCESAAYRGKIARRDSAAKSPIHVQLGNRPSHGMLIQRGRRLVYIRILYNIQNLRKQIYLQQN